MVGAIVKGFSSIDDPSHEGKTNTWLTPKWLVESLGEFDLDPCGAHGWDLAKQTMRLPFIDGLEAEWYKRVWLNPPYGRHIGKWLNKLQQHGNGIALVFARTDTKWFHDLKPDLIFFLKGRIKFLREDFTEDSNAGHGSMLLCFGAENTKSVMNSNIKGKGML